MEIIKANVHLLPVTTKREKGQIGCEIQKNYVEKTDVIRFMFPVFEPHATLIRLGKTRVFNLYLTTDSIIFKGEVYLNICTGEILINEQNALNDINGKKVIGTTESKLKCNNNLILDHIFDQEITQLVCDTYNKINDKLDITQINYNPLFVVELDKKNYKLRSQKRYWSNLKNKFKEPKDVPSLPTGIESNEWKRFFVWKLVKLGAIPKEKLQNGFFYYGKCRNNNIAKWNQEKNCFEYEREEFGVKYTDTINHFEDDNGYDLFVPLKKIFKKDLQTT